jgi:acyl-CoA synthetase (AMP-forming)/AMP-acid ligase II
VSGLAAGWREDAWRDVGEDRRGGAPPRRLTLAGAWAEAAAETVAGITLLDDGDGPERFRSWSELHAASARVAGALAARGVRQGDRVLLVLGTSFEFVLAFFALQHLGAVPVPAYPPATLESAEVALERLVHIAAHADVRLCVTHQKLVPLLGGLSLRARSLRQIVAAEGLEAERAGGETAPAAAVAATDPGFIQYTSGSTGQPKGVLLSQQAVCWNVHAAGQALQVTAQDVEVSWLPLYHDMGLIGGLLFTAYWRLPLVLMSPTAFLLRPVRWLQAISRHRGTLTASPSFAFALCTRRATADERAGLDLSSWRCALNGAETVSLATIAAFQAAFGPCGFRAETMYPVYGLAECAVAVTFPRPGAPVRHVEGGTHPRVCLGQVIPGHALRVVDGEIQVRGPSLMDGYFRDEAATARALEGGWLRTGDLGFLDEAGGLFLTGRAKDLVIVRGHNHHPEDVEAVIEAVPGVRAGGAVVFSEYDPGRAGERAVAVCEVRAVDEGERGRVEQAIREAVSLRCGLALDRVVLVAPGTLPKTSSGKRQRAETRARLAAGTLVRRRSGVVRVLAGSLRGFVVLAARAVRRLGS